MEIQENKASEYFYQGNLSKAATLIRSNKQEPWDAEQAQHALAAMCLSGQAQQAEVILKQHSRDFSQTQLVACRYYLAVGYTMSGRFKRARRYIVGNFAKRHICEDAQSAFYMWQGLAFYRYFTGRLAKGLRASSMAFDCAAFADFTYGRMIACEIKGHLLVQTGNSVDGIAALEHASQLARVLNNTMVLKSVTVALATYESRFARNAQNSLNKLNEVIDALPLEDAFAESSLRFEIARQLIGEGNLKKARFQLDSVQQLIYGHSHYRYEATLSIRYADWHFANGGSWEALHHIMTALKQLDKEIDGLLIVEALMRKVRILKAIGEAKAWRHAFDQLEETSKITGDYASQQFLLEPLSKEILPKSASIPKGVNHRQVKILRFLETNEFIDVSTAKTMFDVAEITVCRDLSSLAKSGHVQRVGRARATRYTRKN